MTTTAPRHRHLTKPMRDALRRARSQPLRRVFDDRPGRPPWPAHPCTLVALRDRGLLTIGRRLSRQGFPIIEWSITDDGLQALEAKTIITRRLRPLYLAEGWPDYTSDIGRAMRGEPEVIREAA